MPIYSSDSDDNTPMAPKRYFAKPLHAILGGGKVGDILLWRNNKLSGGILIGSTIIWSLFQVGDYNFVTLSCHIAITAMLLLFLWSSSADLIHRSPPDPKAIAITETTVHWLFTETNKMLLMFYQISSGKDIKAFSMVIAFLWIMSGIGNYISPWNMLYIGFLGLMSLPALYERYQKEVDELADEGNRNVKKLYKKFDKKLLNKIPRGPMKKF